MRWYDEYLTSVAQQIRVKRAREPLMRELEDHLEMQKSSFMEEGLSEDEAQRRAIADMGDALLVGGALDQVHRPRMQWKGLAIALFFLALGVAFQCFFSCEGIINGKNLAVTCLTAGILILLSATDYTFWIRLALPALLLWLILWSYRAYVWVCMPGWSWSRILSGAHFYLSIIGPEAFSVAAPLLTAFLACRLRGRSWGAFAVCAMPPVLTALLAHLYRHTGHSPNAMMLIALCAFAVMFFSVRGGFFRIPKRAAFLILLVLCALPCAEFLQRLVSNLQHSPYTDGLSQVLRASRVLGEGEAAAILSELDWRYPDSTYLLPMLVHRFGWIPFGLFTLGLAALLAWCFVRFAALENRMGALLGRAATLTMSAQVLLFYLFSFTGYSDFLCLPLVSYGNTVLLIDGVLAGSILSALRGQSLPEPERFSLRSA